MYRKSRHFKKVAVALVFSTLQILPSQADAYFDLNINFIDESTFGIAYLQYIEPEVPVLIVSHDTSTVVTQDDTSTVTV